MDKIKIYKEEILKWLASDFIESLKNGKNDIEYIGSKIIDNKMYNVYSTNIIKRTSVHSIGYVCTELETFIEYQDNTKGYIVLCTNGYEITLSTMIIHYLME